MYQMFSLIMHPVVVVVVVIVVEVVVVVVVSVVTIVVVVGVVVVDVDGVAGSSQQSSWLLPVWLALQAQLLSPHTRDPAHWSS